MAAEAVLNICTQLALCDEPHIPLKVPLSATHTNDSAVMSCLCRGDLTAHTSPADRDAQPAARIEAHREGLASSSGQASSHAQAGQHSYAQHAALLPGR